MPEKTLYRRIKIKISYIIRSLQTFFSYKIYEVYSGKSHFNIPIIINNRNRLTYLLELINSLEKRGYRNIFIIDNKSDYQPLLDYYKTTPYNVFRLTENIGFTALWDTDIFKAFKDHFYVYTDSDLKIVDECPRDFMRFFMYLHKKYPVVGKVGFGLKIDDLPQQYRFRDKVVEWENKLLQKGRMLEKLAAIAQIDTTFALYKKGKEGAAHKMTCIRTLFPYTTQHLPWYEDSDNLTEEQNYYYKTSATSTHWSKLIKQNKG